MCERYALVSGPFVLLYGIWNKRHGSICRNEYTEHHGDVCEACDNGLCGGIMLGIEMGSADMPKVYRYADRFNRISIIAGLVSCSIIVALMLPVQHIYGINGTLEGECVRSCMCVLAIYCIPNAVNCIKVEGIFRSGGDVRYLTLMDAGSIWMIGMPLTLILGLIFKVDIWYVYAAHIAIELFKLPLGQRRLRSRKWYHNVTEAVSSVENN